MGQFALALGAFADKAMENAEAVALGIALEVGERLIERSPVDTGFFRANWNGSFDKPDFTVAEVAGTSEAPARPPTPFIEGRLLGRTFYWSNGVPYGPALEEGHSKQRPIGFVRVTVMEYRTIVLDVVAGLNLR